ncbi:T9SS type A sorting domain-containing protein [candidate division KSB1 bacterium]|nr:T9SS type A sorting domain-containing protein [candidate division KSB1 bacterium]
MKIVAILIALLLLFTCPTVGQDGPTAVDYLIYRLDYQTYQMKHLYYLQDYAETSASFNSHQVYHGLDVEFKPAGDFGSTTIRNVFSNQIVYKASTVWSGTGQHIFPTNEFIVEEPGDSSFFQTDPEFIDLATYFFDESDVEHWKQAYETVTETTLANFFPRHKNYGVLCYLHYFTVGVSDPSTAEWIFIIYTIPENTPPNYGYRWTPIDGNLPTQPVLSIATHNFYGDSLWIGTESGAYFSSNRGEFWSAVQTDNHAYGAVTCMTSTPNPWVNCLCSIVGFGTKILPAVPAEWGFVYRSFLDGETWENMNAPLMPVTALAFNPVNPGTMWAAMYDNGSHKRGLYRRHHSGEWEEVFPESALNVDPFPLTTIVIDERDTAFVAIGSQHGLFITTDDGKSWNQVLISLPVVSIIIDHQTQQRRLIVATNGDSKSDGIWMSKNDGDDWDVLHWQTDIVSLVRARNTLAMSPMERWYYYMAVDNHGVFESMDDCHTWNDITGNLPERTFQAFAVHPGEFRSLYLGTDNGIYSYQFQTPRFDLSVSDDDLTYWPNPAHDGEPVAIYATVHNNSPASVYNIEVAFLDNADGMLPVIDPIDTLVIPSIPANSEYTLKADWYPQGQAGTNFIIVQVDPKSLIAEFDESNNEASIQVNLKQAHGQYIWKDISGDMGDHWINDIAIDPFKLRDLYVATKSGAFTGTISISIAPHWEELAFANNYSVNVTQIAAEMHPELDHTIPVVWLGTEEYTAIPEDRYGRVMLSDDGGSNWHDMKFPNIAVSAIGIEWNLGLSPFVAAWNPFYYQDSYYTLRHDSTWQERDLTPDNTTAQRINCITVGYRSPVQSVPPDLFLGTQSGLFIVAGYDGNITRALDGLNVVSVVSPFGDMNEFLYAATYGENDSDGVYMSITNGDSWEKVFSSHNIVALDGSGMIITSSAMMLAPYLYVAVKNDGVFQSRNGGQSWINITENLTDRAFTCLNVDRNDARIAYLGTETGIYMYTEQPLTDMNRSAGIQQIDRFTINQNYPNPFNSSTIISYTLPEAGEARITIYNTLGQQVQEFVRHHPEAGQYSLRWDGTNQNGEPVNSGVYMCRVQHSVGSALVKMVYVK